MINLTRVKLATSEFIKILVYGKSDVRTAEAVTLHGFESKPLKDALAIYARTKDTGQAVVLGYLLDYSKTEPGEARIYATDENGVEQSNIYLRKDGFLEIGGTGDNMVRFSDLKTAYDQLKSDHDDTVGKLNAVISLLKSWTVVPQDGGLALQVSAQTLQNAANSTGDISTAKINQLITYSG